MIRVTLLKVLMLVFASSVVAAESGRDESRRDFQTIAAQLDPGGELFLVLHAGRWIDRTLMALVAGRDGLPSAEPGEQEIRDRIESLRRFMNTQGISGFRGIGASSVALAEGRHSVKLFLLRDTVDSNLPFWRGTFGWQPRRLLSLDFVPSGFSMVRAGTIEPMPLWRVLSEGMRDAALPVSQARFDAVSGVLKQWCGMAPDVLLGSLRDELLVAVRFSAEAMVDLPAGSGETVSVPVPSFLMVVGTGEDLLRGAVEAQLALRQIPLSEMVVAGERIRCAQAPLSAGPLPFQPAFASVSGYFILGSSPAVVEEALLAYRHRHGLITRPAFKAAFQGVSMVNNGVLYIDDEAARIVRHWCESRVEVAAEMAALSPSMLRIRKALTVLAGDLPACALTIQNWRHGVMLSGTTGIGGEALIRRVGGAGLDLWNAVLDYATRLPAVQEGR